MTTYLLDTTVLIAHLRGDGAVTDRLLALSRAGNDLATSAVNVAELTRGRRASERRATEALLGRLAFLPTTREAARRAGSYQRNLAADGVTLHTADALVAGTARAHGAALMTDNLSDFPMRDVRVESPRG